MIPAVAPPKEGNIEQTGPLPTRDELLACYRHLRKISKRHRSRALDFVSKSAILHQARRLGMFDGKTLILDGMDELTLAFDLVIHTAPAGRSRAIDRYARNSPPPSGSDEAVVLDAMRDARFAVLKMERRHPVAGMVLADLFRDKEVWLVDEGLETWLKEGMALATRYYTPKRFSMTAGVGMPVHRNFLKDAIEAVPQLLRKPMLLAIDDPRFAEAVYRAAVREGIMKDMMYLDPPAEGYAA